MKFRHQFSNPPVYTGKEMSQEKVTTPDQTLTIRQIMTNHTRGVGVDNIVGQGEYFDTEIPIFEDLSDVMDYKNSLDERKQELDNQVNTLQTEYERLKTVADEMAQNSGKGRIDPTKTSSDHKEPSN